MKPTIAVIIITICLIAGIGNSIQTILLDPEIEKLEAQSVKTYEIIVLDSKAIFNDVIIIQATALHQMNSYYRFSELDGTLSYYPVSRTIVSASK